MTGVQTCALPIYGPYISFKLFKKGLHIFRPGNGDVAINLVPIDFIIDSTMFLAYLESSIGKTFALCDPNPIQFKEFLNLTADIYPAKKFFITIPPVALKMSLSLPGISSWLEIQKNSIDYANHHVIYDCTQTCEALKDSGISCPPLESYLEKLIRFFQKNQKLVNL